MKKNGFTLIELMIVLSIIGILAGYDDVVVPNVATRVVDQPNLDNCSKVETVDNRTPAIYSCPDGKIYTKK